MRLLIVSHTPHYLRQGEVVGWGATVREVDHLATLFQSIVHIAPLHAGEAPGSATAYASDRIRLYPVAPSGGTRLFDKLGVALRYPGYARAILQHLRGADVVHVRAPASISLLALILLACVRRPQLRWAKYAGEWTGRPGEPWSYRCQRWWLARRLHRGVVTVNGRSPIPLDHVHAFPNPSVTEAELQEGIAASRHKQLVMPIELLFVGRLEPAKGPALCLDVLALLTQAGVDARLSVIGEGHERSALERKAAGLGVAARVRFHGGLPRDAVGRYYAAAHFIVLPSSTEGWPKVLSEAMAYGAVPIASAVGSIPEQLAAFDTGCAVRARDPRMFADGITAYLSAPSRWVNHSRNAVRAAEHFSYSRYLDAVRAMLPVHPDA